MNLFSTLADRLLRFSASLKDLGIHLIRVAIFVIFAWIGGLKFYNYEAEGIVHFVANSPFMSFFYTKDAPEYKEFKLKEGEVDAAKQQWHEENNTYVFSKAWVLPLWPSACSLCWVSFGLRSVLWEPGWCSL